MKFYFLMVNLALSVIKLFTGKDLTDLIGGMFKDKKKAKAIGEIASWLKKYVDLTEKLGAFVKEKNDDGMPDKKIAKIINERYDLDITMQELRGMITNSAKTKFELVYRLGKKDLLENNVEFTEQLIRLAIELLVHKL